MADVCAKCGSERVILLTSIVCNCPREGAVKVQKFRTGQVLTSSDEITEAFRAGCCVRSTLGGDRNFRRAVGDRIQKWTLSGWVDCPHVLGPGTWNLAWDWVITDVDSSKLDNGPSDPS